MDRFLFPAVIVMLGVVLCVLITGVTVFVKGGELNRRYGNKLMNLRVATQFIALMLLGLLMFLRHH